MNPFVDVTQVIRSETGCVVVVVSDASLVLNAHDTHEED